MSAEDVRILRFTVYWCPTCKRQTRGPWHSLGDGGLIPQTATEHECERIEAVPAIALACPPKGSEPAVTEQVSSPTPPEGATSP